MPLQDVKRVAVSKGIYIQKYQKVILPGWINQPKGLLQVLYERVWIDTSKLSEYSDSGKQHQLNENGNVLPKYSDFLLRNIMDRCRDFCDEPTAMGRMFDQLSKQKNATITMLISPKYHCEIAGEGIEYNWGICKKHYRNGVLGRCNQ